MIVSKYQNTFSIIGGIRSFKGFARVLNHIEPYTKSVVIILGFYFLSKCKPHNFFFEVFVPLYWKFYFSASI